MLCHSMAVRVSFKFILSVGIFSVFVYCGVWRHIGHADLVQSYAVDASVQNKALVSRLCGADRHATVLYGVFSTAEKVLFRNATRQQGQCHLNSNVHSTVFVVGVPRTEREHTILKREAAMYGDIFTLSCRENMNEGKSYTYFKEALEHLSCFDFYAKVDDDTTFVPDKLSVAIQSVSMNTPVIIGRHEVFPTINDPWFYVVRYPEYGFRDLSWTQNMQSYTAGMLYVLNRVAIKRWIALDPTQLYGDEDMRTSYYMKLIGAEVINMRTAFHDHMRSRRGLSPWTAPITNNSLAVHQCKEIELLLDSFASLCRT